MSVTRRALIVVSSSTTPERRIVASACSHFLNAGWTYRLVGWSNEHRRTILREVGPDVVLVLPGGTDEQNAEFLALAPCLGVNVRLPGCPTILPDELAIGRQAAEHFLDRGLQNLAFIAYSHDWAFQRAAGFAQRAGQAGTRLFAFESDPHTMQRLEPQGVYCNLMLRQFLLNLPKPVGLMVACDGWAVHVLEQVQQAGLRVPEDVAVVGVDDDEFACELAVPPLSSVVVPWERMGQEAALSAMRLVSGDTPGRFASAGTGEGEALSGLTGVVTLPPAGVRARRSSDAIAVGDPEVQAALRVIHDHADKPLTVSGVLKLVPSHQHRLEKLFRKHIGRTMIAEIRRVHVQQAVRLLTSTSLNVAQIAQRSGFASTKLLTQALRKECGLTPSEFRRSIATEPEAGCREFTDQNIVRRSGRQAAS